VVNVRGIPYVIPDSVPPAAGEESEEQTLRSRPALTGRKMNAEEATPARAAAGRPRQDGGASADFRVRVGGGNFCFENLIKVACWKRQCVSW
jgi:hypothetical protein